MNSLVHELRQQNERLYLLTERLFTLNNVLTTADRVEMGPALAYPSGIVGDLAGTINNTAELISICEHYCKRLWEILEVDANVSSAPLTSGAELSSTKLGARY